MTIETEKSLTVRVTGERYQEFCETCDSKTPLLIVRQTAQLAGMSARLIF